MTLTDFLLARIAEDEALAHRVFEDEGTWFSVTLSRVLAECEAKRRIVRMRQNAKAFVDEVVVGMLIAKTLDAALAHLALPYADHPDYRQEWKP